MTCTCCKDFKCIECTQFVPRDLDSPWCSGECYDKYHEHDKEDAHDRRAGKGCLVCRIDLPQGTPFFEDLLNV